MNLLVNEFVQYLIKFIVLGVIAVLGVMCGAKYKKNKLAKENAASGETTDVDVQ